MIMNSIKRVQEYKELSVIVLDKVQSLSPSDKIGPYFCQLYCDRVPACLHNYKRGSHRPGSVEHHNHLGTELKTIVLC